MYILAHFTRNGIDEIGLSPVINIYRTSDDVQVVTSAIMTELSEGHYKYNFTAPTSDIDYYWKIDSADGTMSNFDRYKKGGTHNQREFQIQSIEDKVDTIDTVVDSIQVDTDNIEPKVDQVITEHVGINGKLDTVQTDLDNPNQYKADVSNLALESTSQLIKTETDKIQTIDDNVDTLLSRVTASIYEAWQKLADVAITGTEFAGSLYKLIYDRLDVVISSRSAHSPSDVDVTLSGTHGAGSWESSTADVDLIDSNNNKDIIAKALKERNVSATPDVVGSIYKDINDNIDVNESKIDSVLTNIASLDDKIIRVLGLVQSNYRVDNPTYSLIGNAYRLMSGTITIYPTAADADAGTNAIESYDMIATYDANGNMLTYKVTEN